MEHFELKLSVPHYVKIKPEPIDVDGPEQAIRFVMSTFVRNTDREYRRRIDATETWSIRITNKETDEPVHRETRRFETISVDPGELKRLDITVWIKEDRLKNRDLCLATISVSGTANDTALFRAVDPE